MVIKAVFHIDEEEKWELALSNVKNLLAEAPDASIEVVANSIAVKEYKKDSNRFIRIMENLVAQKVKFCACNNSLISQKIDKGVLSGFVVIVPAGVKEIAEKQLEGYAYIKP